MVVNEDYYQIGPIIQYFTSIKRRGVTIAGCGSESTGN